MFSLMSLVWMNGMVALASAQTPAAPPKAVLEVFTSVQAIAPGAEFQLALRFKLQPDWHIYWADPGDAGRPPRIKLNAPEGFIAGPLQFPVPTRHVAQGPLSTNILLGQPILLMDIKAPADLPKGDKLNFEVEASWVICKENCLFESQKVTMALPVTATATPTPANIEIFAQAKATHPARESDALKVIPSLSTDKLTAGDSFELVLQLIVPDGMAIAAHEGSAPTAKPLDVFIMPTQFVTFSAPIFPDPRTRKAADASSISEYLGRIFLRIPAKLDPKASAPPTTFEGIVTFQPYNEKSGKYLEPQALSWSLTVPAPGT